ncbi:MAG TPA: glycoside hydrolase family 3 N-terminal domain-containing protein, partial [bacterium]
MKFKIAPSARALKMADSLSIRDLIAQCICPYYTGEKRGPFGAMFIGHEIEQAKERIKIAKGDCAIPPLITSDMECGPGKMVRGLTKFPDMMSLGAANDETLAYEVGKATALEGAWMGYNWTLAPCVDLCENPDSPVVSGRTPGRDPQRVIRITGSYIRGLQDHQMMATMKHFPGDGFTPYDQHLTTVYNPLSMEEWRKQSGKVFGQLVETGVMAVMPGHIGLPAYDERDSETGMFPPATISKKLKVDLLRSELGFEGLIVSDDIGMGGVSGFRNYYECCALFWETGGDCLLFARVSEHFYKEMERFLKSGFLKEATLRNRAARIIAVKEHLGLLDSPAAVPVYDKEKHRELSNRVIEKSATLVRNRKGIIPFSLTKKSKVLHLILSTKLEEEKEIHERFTQALAKVAGVVDEKVAPGSEWLHEAAISGGYDLI